MKYYFLGLATLVAVCTGCHAGSSVKQTGYPPPANMMARPGPMVDGPGPGVLNMMSGPPPRAFATTTTQINFANPEGMGIGWQIPGGYAENQLTAPRRYNFRQASTYRLKLTTFPNRPGLVLYPTLQIYPAHPLTDAYLAHNCVPIQITDEDLDQVVNNNFVTKVIYLPSAQNQDLAIAGVETLVSTRLDPGVDPVAEADRRGTIMAVLRMGNMTLETAPDGSIPGDGNPNGNGDIQQMGFIRHVNGEEGQFAPPVSVQGMGAYQAGIPPAMLMSTAGGPDGMATGPTWGMPMTGTPIGLPGPPHLPYGGPAGLKSHTVRNKTKQHIPDPVDHMLIDVKHKPGIAIPDPVRHIQYTEKHDPFPE